MGTAFQTEGRPRAEAPRQPRHLEGMGEEEDVWGQETGQAPEVFALLRGKRWGLWLGSGGKWGT